MVLVDADYITIKDNVQVLKENPNPSGEWDVFLPSRTLPINTTIRIITIGQSFHSSGLPEAIGNLANGEYIKMVDLKRAPISLKGNISTKNIVIGIVIIVGAYFLYKKFKK